MKKKEIKFLPDGVPYDVQAFLDFIGIATSPYHAVLAASARLREAGFSELALGGAWEISAGGKYFVNVYDGALLAFTVGAAGPLRIRISLASG